MFKKKEKEVEDMTPAEAGEEVDAMIEEMAPHERDKMKALLRSLTNELMERTQTNRMLEKELKEAVKRKKVRKNPFLKEVALVMFYQPKIGGAKPKMTTSDNVHTALAIRTVGDLLRDKDNEFIGAYFLSPMAGRKDALKRLETNAEAAWHLFQILDRDLKLNDPESSIDCPTCNNEDDKKKGCEDCNGMGRVLKLEDIDEEKTSDENKTEDKAAPESP